MVASFMFPVNHQVVFLFTSKTSFKRKQELRDLVVDHGATVSYIITKKTSIVIAESADVDTDNYKIKQALKLGIPIVSLQYLDDCVQKQRYLDPSRYLVVAPDKKDEKFDKGQIKAPLRPINTLPGKKTTTRPEGIPAYKPEDNKCPQFIEPRLVKAALFQKTEDGHQLYQVLELHISADQSGMYKYRISTQSATNKHGSVTVSETEYRFTNDADSALSVYSFLYMRYNNGRYCLVQQVPAGIIRKLGSKLFQEWFQQNMYSSSIDIQVAQVIETMWFEAVDSVEEQISTPIPYLKLSEVEKAETDLRCLKEALKNKKSKSDRDALRQEYYKHLPHHEPFKLELNSMREISREQDLCQVIKDVIAISESTDWSSKVSSLSKYNALHCYIQRLSEDDQDFVNIANMIHDSHESLNKLKIHNIFQVCRQIEQKNFRKLHNKQLMFHGSKLHNYVGLLSRGLLLPQTVVEDFGGGRSDPGMLGYAVYFSDSAYTSLKYTTPSNIRGSTFLLVNEVALGDVYHTKTKMMDMKAPPEGFDSVHGIKCSSAENTEFEDDEYAIYDINQQCIRYLVELSLPEDNVCDVPVLLPEADDMDVDKMEEPTEIDITDIKDVASPLSKVDVGLCSDGNKKIPLKSVHIQAKLVDLAAEVVVLQEYFNDNNSAIEAKYVFPLDDNAAVCGFEAFINGKHIIGTVKEKEEAHKEYKEAISKGHGAYLMDEEKADVFTVRVGNLPPKACVLIKITYVAELSVIGELIDFYLPGSVASWDKHIALSEIIQTDVEAVDITKGDVPTTVQVSMEMPFDIRTITSPTHKIKMKKTATKAVVELPKNASLGRHGFRLQISLSHIHVPRMWVEQHPDSDSQACMLTFYPEFDAEDIPDPEIIFLVDCSNSMKGEAMIHAKKLVLLALEMLPKMCRFNIIAFGTTYRELFQKMEAVTDKSLKEAKNFVKSLTATQGNTNVWAPIEMLAMLSSKSHIHNIYLLSDGHLSNFDSLLKLINEYRMVNRIFTLSVGNTSDLYVMKTVARIGGGSSQHYDPSLKSKWQQMLQDQLMKSAQPSLSAVQVEWQQLDENCKTPVQAPRALMSLYNGQREVIYGFVAHCTMAVLKAEINGREVATLVSTHELNITTGKILHTLTARAIIRDWQNGLLAPDKIEHELIKLSNKSDIIDLSKKYSVVTPFTSFVAIEQRKKDETPQKGPRIEELILKENADILDYMDWQIQVDEEMPIDQKIEQLLEKAVVAESYSVPEATRLYEEVEKMLPDLAKVDRNVIDLQRKVHQSLYEFYVKICKDELKANRYANLLKKRERFFMAPEQQYQIQKPIPCVPRRFHERQSLLTPTIGALYSNSVVKKSVMAASPKICIVRQKKKSLPKFSHQSVESNGPEQAQQESPPHPAQASQQGPPPSLFTAEVSSPGSRVVRGPEPFAEKEGLFSGESIPVQFSAAKLKMQSQPAFDVEKQRSLFGGGPSQTESIALFGQSTQIKGFAFGAPSQANDLAFDVEEQILFDIPSEGIVQMAEKEASEECFQGWKVRGSVETTGLQGLAGATERASSSQTTPMLARAPPIQVQLQEAKMSPPKLLTAPHTAQQQATKPPKTIKPLPQPLLQVTKPPPQSTKPLQPPAPPQSTKPLQPPAPLQSTKPLQPPAPLQSTKPPAPPPPPLPQETKPVTPKPPPPLQTTKPPEEEQQQQQNLHLVFHSVQKSAIRGQQQVDTEVSTAYDDYDKCVKLNVCDLFGDELQHQDVDEKYQLEEFTEENDSSWESDYEENEEESMSFDGFGDFEAPQVISSEEKEAEYRSILDEEAVEKEDSMDIISTAVSHLEKLNKILKEKYCQLQHPILNVHLNKLETNMTECLDAISEIRNNMAKYSQPTPPENIWLSVTYRERTANRQSGVDALFKLKQNVFWCPDDKLKKLIGIDFDKLKRILVNAGLRSLGTKAEIEVMQYFATIFVLLTILQLTSDISPETLMKYINMNLQITDIQVNSNEQSVIFTAYKTGETILECHIDPEKWEALDETVHWLVKQDSKYPALDTMLELSATKVTILLQMFQALFTITEA